MFGKKDVSLSPFFQKFSKIFPKITYIWEIFQKFKNKMVKKIHLFFQNFLKDVHFFKIDKFSLYFFEIICTVFMLFSKFVFFSHFLTFPLFKRFSKCEALKKEDGVYLEYRLKLKFRRRLKLEYFQSHFFVIFQ